MRRIELFLYFLHIKKNLYLFVFQNKWEWLLDGYRESKWWHINLHFLIFLELLDMLIFMTVMIFSLLTKYFLWQLRGPCGSSHRCPRGENRIAHSRATVGHLLQRQRVRRYSWWNDLWRTDSKERLVRCWWGWGGKTRKWRSHTMPSFLETSYWGQLQSNTTQGAWE